MTSTESAWRYDPAPDLEQSIRDRLRRFPRQPDMLVYGLRALAAFVMRGWLKAYHRFEILGRENLPAAGSFVLIANHSSHLDALCLVNALPLRRMHRVFPAAAADYFFRNLPRTLLSAVFINALPFERKDSPRQSLALCRGLLEQPGNVLVIFPEGTRSPDGVPRSFKPGIGLIACGQAVPVIPCWLEGCHRAWAKGMGFPRPVRIRLTIGRPMSFRDREPGKENALAIAGELELAVRQLMSGGESTRQE